MPALGTVLGKYNLGYLRTCGYKVLLAKVSSVKWPDGDLKLANVEARGFRLACLDVPW